MKMTPAILIICGIMVYIASISLMVILPAAWMRNLGPSEIWREWTPDEEQGHQLFNNNGCSYCHSQFIRNIDWGHGAERIAEAGDYYKQPAQILGTERTGPDLSMEGGQHPNDWHMAHFNNPRYTSPYSVMPTWQFLGDDKIRKLIAYMQAEGGKFSDPRVVRQGKWKKEAVKAYIDGPDKNVQWIHEHVPEGAAKSVSGQC
jgi:cbb3-type cytochrome c oxidase subunit II